MFINRPASHAITPSIPSIGNQVDYVVHEGLATASLLHVRSAASAHLESLSDNYLMNGSLSINRLHPACELTEFIYPLEQANSKGRFVQQIPACGACGQLKISFPHAMFAATNSDVLFMAALSHSDGVRSWAPRNCQNLAAAAYLSRV